MENEKKIFWIASYPKSGNTLFRAILSSLFLTNDGKFSFELLNFIRFFETANRLLFIKSEKPKNFKKINEIKILSKYWLEMQTQKRLKIKESFCFLKTHSALLKLYGNDFTNEKTSRGLIYLVRDPRDVTLSWAKHRNKSIENTINFMINHDANVFYNDLDILDNRELKPKLLMSRWDTHVSSWQYLNVPKLFLKYEDLIENKKTTILKVVNFFEKNYGFKFNNLDHKINNILITTDFKSMKKTEEEQGFKEAKQHAKFFNVGKKDQWKDKLKPKEIEKIEKEFNKQMRKFNYL